MPHINPHWLLLPLIVIAGLIIALKMPTEQKLEQTDLRKKYRKKNNIK